MHLEDQQGFTRARRSENPAQLLERLEVEKEAPQKTEIR
jgi:hypothetical protein